MPFAKDASLELDPNNLISLCMDKGHDCHILIGHGDDFKAYNPNVVADATEALLHPEKIREIQERAKVARLKL